MAVIIDSWRLIVALGLFTTAVAPMFVYYQNYEYLSTIKLNDYSGYYGNVKLSRYSIPSDVLSAIWRLQLVATDGCPATNFYFYLEYSAYPVISPNNATFPDHFTSSRLTKTHVMRTLGGGSSANASKLDVYVNVTSPYAGYWFSSAFVDSSSSDDQKVKPDLFRSNCSFYLTPSVNLWQINDTWVLYPNQTVFSAAHTVFRIFKYFSVSFDGPLKFELNFDTTNQTETNPASSPSSSSSCLLTALLRQSAFPDMSLFTNNNDFTMCQKNMSTDPTSSSSSSFSCRLAIEHPLVSTWYYVAVSSTCNYTVDVRLPKVCNSGYGSTGAGGELTEPTVLVINNLTQPILDPSSASFLARSSKLATAALNDSTSSSSSSSLYCVKQTAPIETFRFIGPTYFSVKYYFNSNYNRSNALLVRDDNKPYFIEFLVDLANNGGTMNFYLANNLIYDPTYAASLAVTPGGVKPAGAAAAAETAEVDNSSNSTGSRLDENVQIKNRAQAPVAATSGAAAPSAAFDLHARVKENNLASLRVMLKACLLYNSMDYRNCPPGYLMSVQSFTHVFTNMQLSVPYPYMGKWYLAIWKECSDLNTNESLPCPAAYVPYTIVQMVSDQCSNNYCGDYGTCYIINSQLNLVSACKCVGGYEGFGCSDSRKAVPARLYIASVLFLTMSNLIFLVPICLAIYRRWYIEALIYFYNMFFSTFYHACDQEFYAFCIFNYDGLQLADFISSYSSFVITVLSMSAFVRPWKVFTFFVGLLACLTINLYDRFSNVAFIVFLTVSISITVLTWVKICISKRRLHPTRKQLLKYYLPGVALALTGISIYGFLQTKSNYWVLHSIWHMCMASSIVFFLPKRDRTGELKPSSSSSSSSSSTPTGELKDVATTTSSMSDSSSPSSSSPQSPQALLHANATEITLLEQQ